MDIEAVTEGVVAKFSSLIITHVNPGHPNSYFSIYRQFDEDEELAREGCIEWSEWKHNWILSTEPDDSLPGFDATDLVHIAEFMLGLEEETNGE